MSRTAQMLTLAGTDANTLHTLLMNGQEFEVPSLDLDSTVVPDIPGIDAVSSKIDLEALTERKVKGKGVFDGLMESVKAHIQDEFEAGRITANEWTKNYVAMTESAMVNAVQFLLQKDTAYWQGITAQLQAIQAKIQLEVTIQTAKAQLATYAHEAKVKEAQYTNTKMQTLGVESSYQLSEFNLTKLMPANESLLREQIEVQRAQTMDTRTDGSVIKGSVGKNKELTDAQITAFERDAQYKVGKLHSDTWVAMRSTDSNLSPPSTFTNDSIASVIRALKVGVNIR